MPENTYMAFQWETKNVHFAKGALISGDILGNITYIKDLYKSIKGTDNILFNSGIILNIRDILNCLELILVDIQQLLYNGNKLGLTYLFQGDVNNAPRCLKPPSLALTKS